MKTERDRHLLSSDATEEYTEFFVFSRQYCYIHRSATVQLLSWEQTHINMQFNCANPQALPDSNRLLSPDQARVKD